MFKAENMNSETSKPIKILCILSFIVVALTSIPLLIAYLKESSAKPSLIVNMHVWAGAIFIVFAVLRIVREKFKKKDKTNSN